MIILNSTTNLYVCRSVEKAQSASIVKRGCCAGAPGEGAGAGVGRPPPPPLLHSRATCSISWTATLGFRLGLLLYNRLESLQLMRRCREI